MVLEQVSVYLSQFDLLTVFGMGMATGMFIMLLGAAIRRLCTPSAHKQRLLQIQGDKKYAQRELAKLTQDYLQRVKKSAPGQQSQRGGSRNPARVVTK